MPTYTVKDPQSGRTLKLRGDSPPTEQELEEIFAHTAPPKGLLSRGLDTAKDLSIGALKGLGETVTSGTVLAPLINKMAAAKDSRAALPADNAADKFLSDTLTSSNKTQMVGKGLEIGAEILGPGAFSKLSKFLAGRKAAPISTNTLKELPLYKQMEHLGPRQGGAVNAPVRIGGPAHVPQPITPARVAQNTQSRGIVVKAGETFEPGNVSRLPGRPGAPLSKSLKSTSGGEPLITEALAGKRAVSATPPKRALSEGEEAGIKALDDLQRAIHGDDAAAVGNGLYKVAETSRAAATPDAAAETIEKAIVVLTQGGKPASKVKLSTEQLGRVMRDRFGSARGGKMLYPSLKGKESKAALKKLAPGDSKMPEIVKEAIAETGGLTKSKKLNAGYATTLQRYASEGGAASPKVIGSVAGGTIGAAAGATQGETTEDRAFNAILGGVGGAFVVPFIAHAAAVGTAPALKDYLFTSVLSSPGTVTKAYLGAFGGAIGQATEKIAAGNVRDGGAILKALFSGETAITFAKALKHPSPASLSGYGADAPSFVSRVYGAADAAARRAMAAGGVNLDEAARSTLSGVPTTKLGQDTLRLFNEHFSAKLVGSLFPRVGIQILERGAERSPIGLMGLKGLNEGASTATKVARASLGTAVGAGAALGEEHAPAWAQPYLVALSGMYALPTAVGMAASKANQKGSSSLRAVTDEVARNLPFPQFGPAEALDPFRMAASLVPNVVRDVAEAKDPYQRDTSGSGLNRIKAKIPGLRETLPAKGALTNIAGQPNEDRSSAFTRFRSRPSFQGDKWKGIPKDITQELKRLDVSINPPSFERTIEVRGREVPVPPDLAEKRRAESRERVVPALQKLLGSAEYRRATEVGKKRKVERTIREAMAAGNEKARRNVRRLLQGR